MTPEEIRKLRSELQCTARELAATIGLDGAEVAAWEAGERFPTKKRVIELEKLRARGPSAVIRSKKRRASTNVAPLERLSDPTFWLLLRKLVAYTDLLDQVQAIAANHPDPTSTKSE